jgi:hypothetical protein
MLITTFLSGLPKRTFTGDTGALGNYSVSIGCQPNKKSGAMILGALHLHGMMYNKGKNF